MRFRYSAKENGKHVKKAAVYTQDEHKINFADVDSQAVYITERLQANGYETYIVGGAVRDLILGKKPKDFDIATSANPSKIKKIFRNSRIIGRRFRLVHVFFGPKIFEISTFRSIKDGPTSNTFGTIEEDVQRRDFSLNALFYDPQKQVVVDYVGGMKDIKKRVIRPIIALAHIFTDDPVRMIRAVKYGAATGFRLPLPLKWKIRKHADLLAGVSPSRLTEEIFKIIHSSQALEIVKGLDALGLYRFLQPEAAKLLGANPNFRERYFKTLSALNSENSREKTEGSAAGDGSGKAETGAALSALIRDYLDDNAGWGDAAEPADAEKHTPSQAERYKNAFALARKFVLPMNPPRMELEGALRLLFAEHGIVIKKSRLGDRPLRRRSSSAGNPGSPEGGEKEARRLSPEDPLPGEPEKFPAKRRRRRRPKTDRQKTDPAPLT